MRHVDYVEPVGAGAVSSPRTGREGTTRWLVRLGYDGGSFAGWARQPGRRTVEGELRHGIARRGLTPDIGAARLEVASRTDRGVSARANAFSFVSTLSGPSLLRALNGISPQIWCTAAISIPEGFRVRGAVRRVYRYYESRSGADPVRRARAAKLLVGAIDVRTFGRGIPAETPARRAVEAIAVSVEDDCLVTEIRAPSFVWGMVRKVIGALREYDAGRLTLDQLDAAARGRVRLTLPLAEPEGLILWEVEYPFAWEFLWTGPGRRQTDYLRMALDGIRVRSQVVRATFGLPAPTSTASRDRTAG